MVIRIEMEVPDSCDPSFILEQAQEMAVDFHAMEMDDDTEFDEDKIQNEVSVQIMRASDD